MTLEQPLALRAPRTLAEAAEQHLDDVYGYLLYLTRDRETAEDLAGSTFEKAVRLWTRFDPTRGTARTWLLGIARKRHQSLSAKETRRRRHEVASAAANPKGPGESGSELGVHEALARLPHHYRDVLEAKYLRRMKTAEIAKTQGQTVPAIESLLRRARSRFAEIYEPSKE